MRARHVSSRAHWSCSGEAVAAGESLEATPTIRLPEKKVERTALKCECDRIVKSPLSAQDNLADAVDARYAPAAGISLPLHAPPKRKAQGMNAKLTRTFLFLSGTLIAGVFARTTSAAKPTTIPIKNMYVLGDSLSDQGNLFQATSEIGPAFNVPPLPDANFYFDGRFSNGEIYAGQLANMLGFTIGPSLAGGNNFAFGGARTAYNTVEPPSG